MKILVFHKLEKNSISKIWNNNRCEFLRNQYSIRQVFRILLKPNSVRAKHGNLLFLFFVSRTTKSAYTTELLLGVICLKQLFDARISMTPLRVKRTTTKLLEGHMLWFADDEIL